MTNAFLPTSPEELHLRCTELAARGGDDKLVSVVALGALVARTGWVTPESSRAALREMAGNKRPVNEDRRRMVEADLGAFGAGFEAGTVGAAA